MNTTKIVLGTLAAVVLIALIVVGGYLGGWWLKKDVTNRDVEIRNRNTGVQTAWRDKALDHIANAELLEPETAQYEALKNQACDLIGRLTETYKTDERIQTFETQECL